VSPTGGPTVRDSIVIERLGAAIATWIDRAERAEAQRTAFAFREGVAPAVVPPVSSDTTFVTRALAAVGDPAILHLLAATRGVTPFDDLLQRADLGVDPGDRVALAEHVALAAGLGLVARELDGDRVACTALGLALLDLVEGLAAAVRAERARGTGDGSGR